MKKDKVFIIVIAVVIANLVYQLLYELMAGRWIQSPVTWFIMIADILGIGGGLYLLKNYKRMRQAIKDKSEDDTKVS